MRKQKDYVLTSFNHKRKLQGRIFTIFAICIFVAIGYYFYQHRFDVRIQSAKLYFYDSSKTELVPVTRKVSLTGQSEKIVKILIEELSVPPEKSGLETFIPAYVRISSVKINDGVCYLVLEPTIVSDSIHTVSEESAAVYSIVNTLTEMDSIQKVSISIQGKKDSNFKQYISIQDPLVRLSGQLPEGVYERIYFYYTPINLHIAQKKEVLYSDKPDIMVKNILNQLMYGIFNNKNITSFFPSDVTINSIKIESGTAYLDLSPEFRRFHYGAIEEIALVNCIVLSLCELPEISQVKFLIDGQTIDSIGGHTDGLQPYNRWYGYNIQTSDTYYFVYKDQQYHFYTPIHIPRSDPVQATISQVIETLLKGPPAKYKELEISSDIPAGTKLLSASPGTDNILSVDLEIELSQFLNAQQEENFLEQLILTITENSSFQKVNLYFNGEALESLPFGTEIKNPITREIP